MESPRLGRAAEQGIAATLGPKFDLKEFHAVVLENGAVPMTLLEQIVNEWIQRTKA